MNKKHLNTENIRNILLIQLGDIGDVILTFPSIKALRECFPLANIIVAVREKARELIEDCHWSNGVISINKRKRSLAQEIKYQIDFFKHVRKFNFDLAIDMRKGDRSAILAFLSGASQRIGYYADDGELWRNRLFTHIVFTDYNPNRYMAEYYHNLLTTYNLGTEDVSPCIEIPPERTEQANALFKSENIPSDRSVIAFQPFSLWQYKEWNIEKYSQLINQIISEYNFSVIIIGSPDERKRADEIISKCSGSTYNFAGKTSIGLLPAVLKKCKLFIGVDSAGMHIAAAVGTPTISIFGPGHSAVWAPRGELHRVVHKNFPCIPCKLKGCNGSEFSRCLEELTPDEVMQVVREQIEKLGIG